MKLEAKPAGELSTTELCDLLNAGFVDYILPIVLTTEHLLSMILSDAVDLRTSRVLHVDGEPCGIGLIARRGRQSRLAAMSVIPPARGRGAGKWLVKELL